ncbi:hypothetical protein HP570_18315 [Brevibacillus sp. RS1.1]|uniref:hypothetical protein n=1 Tax=Brevibacillus sp. RS1.1 TaxID=2738982 RepID=UPI00156B9186|nr:hypothetical protein [Brevibacillus sp. RS1.1]NRR04177.1 hypothetical protein [Brevibacillus sp. RS1.1]
MEKPEKMKKPVGVFKKIGAISLMVEVHGNLEIVKVIERLHWMIQVKSFENKLEEEI